MILLKEKDEMKSKLEREKHQSFFLKQSHAESWTKERNELEQRLTRLQTANVALEVFPLYNNLIAKAD